MCFLHCIAIFYNLPWLSKTKVSYKKSQRNAENAWGNRMCKLSLNNRYARFFIDMYISNANWNNWNSCSKPWIWNSFQCFIKSQFIIQSFAVQNVYILWGRFGFEPLAGGGNIQPAGHIRPARSPILALKKQIWHEFGPRDTNKKAQCDPRTKIVAHHSQYSFILKWLVYIPKI